MNLDRKYLALLAVLVAVNIVMAGLLFARLGEHSADPMAPVAGFKASQLHAPDLPTDDPNHWDTKPGPVSQFWPTGYSLQSRFNLGSVYAIWGGELRCWVQNTGENELYVYGFSLEGDWGAPACASVGIIIMPGAERYLGLLQFPGSADLEEHHFTIRTAIMAERLVEFTPVWHDFGWVGNSVKNITFLPLGKRRTTPRYPTPGIILKRPIAS